VVSFETVEHVPEPRTFVSEVFRVLKPAGLFVVSTPNKDVYHHGKSPNPFHCSEMTKAELLDLLNPCFEIENLFGQVFPSGTLLDVVEQFAGKVSNRLASKLRRSIEEPLRRRFLPDIDTTNVLLRQQIIDSIPNLSPLFSRIWNPYAIQQLPNSSKHQPTYLIIVAKRRISIS